MSDEHDNHGQTPAAWTTVGIIMIAFVVGAVGVVIATPWVFWLGVGLIAVGLIVGKVMALAGLGARPVESVRD